MISEYGALLCAVTRRPRIQPPETLPDSMARQEGTEESNISFLLPESRSELHHGCPILLGRTSHMAFPNGKEAEKRRERKRIFVGHYIL